VRQRAASQFTGIPAASWSNADQSSASPPLRHADDQSGLRPRAEETQRHGFRWRAVLAASGNPVLPTFLGDFAFDHYDAIDPNRTISDYESA